MTKEAKRKLNGKHFVCAVRRFNLFQMNVIRYSARVRKGSSLIGFHLRLIFVCHLANLLNFSLSSNRNWLDSFRVFGFLGICAFCEKQMKKFSQRPFKKRFVFILFFFFWWSFPISVCYLLSMTLCSLYFVPSLIVASRRKKQKVILSSHVRQNK